VKIDGQIVDGLSPKDRQVAMVFQSYALYPHMTVERNIAFPLEVAGVSRDEIGSRVRETAKRLGVESLLARRPKELSGGQRQRVALGRALVRRPKLCLFDEPLSNLDAALRAQMRGELKKLHEDLDATFVYVTHDQTEAMTLSTRMFVLHGGVIQQEGAPREVYAKPSNLFVAGFVGSPRINVVPPDAVGLTRRVEEALGTHRARNVVVGIRPEDLSIGEGEAPKGAPTGTVYVTEPMGGETWVTVDLGGTRVTARAPGDYAGRGGSSVWLAFVPGRALLFDRATERRLDVVLGERAS
jgi:multiple sugar transport system ATP-binding protein